MKRWVVWIAAAGIVVSAAMPASAANLTGGTLGKTIRIGPAVAVPLCDSNHQLVNNVCVPKPVAVPLCDGNHQLVDNVCVLKPCPLFEVHKPNGDCAPITPMCLAPKELFHGLCVAKCPSGQHHTQPNGACAS